MSAKERLKISFLKWICRRLSFVLFLCFFIFNQVHAATFTVSTTADNGSNTAPTPGSLRAAILGSNATVSATPNLINFSILPPTSLLTIPSQLPPITHSVTINTLDTSGGAMGNPFLTISGSNTSAIFFVLGGIGSTPSPAVILTAMTLSSGLSQGGNGGTGNGGGGGLGAGGAVFVDATASLTLNDVSFSANTARGGNGGSGLSTPSPSKNGGGGGGMLGGGTGSLGGAGGQVPNGGAGGGGIGSTNPANLANGGGAPGIPPVGGAGTNGDAQGASSGGTGGTGGAGTATGGSSGASGGTNGGGGGEGGSTGGGTGFGGQGGGGGGGPGGGIGGTGSPATTGFGIVNGGNGAIGGTGTTGGGGGGGGAGGNTSFPSGSGTAGAGGPGGASAFGGGGGGGGDAGQNGSSAYNAGGAGGTGGFGAGGGGGGAGSGTASGGSSTSDVGAVTLTEGGSGGNGGTVSGVGPQLSGGGGGGAGLGGAVFVRSGGTLIINNSSTSTSFSGNSVIGGALGAGTGPVPATGGNASGPDMYIMSGVTAMFNTGSGLTETYFTGVGGNGAVTKQGLGNLIFASSSVSTYRGNTTVNAGTLTVNGSIISPTTVNAGGTLAGTGSIGTVAVNTIPVVNNGGIVSPGSNSIGTLTIFGSFSQPTGILNIEINPAQSSLLRIQGNPGSSNIGTGTSTLNLNPDPGFYSVGTTYTILSTNPGSSSGTFANVTASNNNLGPLVPLVIYNPQSIQVKLVLGAPLDVIAGPQTLATMIQLEELGTLINLMNATRMAFLRDYHDICQMPFFHRVKDDFKFVSFDQNHRRNSKSSSRKGDPLTSNNFAEFRHNKGGVWAHGFGYELEENTSGDGIGFDSRIGGVFAGLDYRFCHDIFLGAGLGEYIMDLTWRDNAGDAKTDGVFLTGYGGWLSPDGFFIDGSLTGGVARITVNRHVAFSTILTSFDFIAYNEHRATFITPHIDIGYDFENCYVVMEPFLSIDYSYVREKSYTEFAVASLALNVQEKTGALLRTELGWAFYKDFDICSTTWTPRAKLSYIYKRPVKHLSETVSFFSIGGIAPFTVESYTQSHNFLAAGVGTQIEFGNCGTIIVWYDAELGQNVFSDEVNVKLVFNF